MLEGVKRRKHVSDFYLIFLFARVYRFQSAAIFCAQRPHSMERKLKIYRMEPVRN